MDPSVTKLITQDHAGKVPFFVYQCPSHILKTDHLIHLKLGGCIVRDLREYSVKYGAFWPYFGATTTSFMYRPVHFCPNRFFASFGHLSPNTVQNSLEML